MEAYMVAYCRPMFADQVYTEKPREELLPAPMLPSPLGKNDLVVLEQVIHAGRPVCRKEVKPEEVSNSTVGRSLKTLESLGMIERVSNSRYMRGNADYYLPTKKGRFNLYAHNGKFDPILEYPKIDS